MAVLSLSGDAKACPFCPASQQTFTEELANSDAAVFAMKKLDPEAFKRASLFLSPLPVGGKEPSKDGAKSPPVPRAD